MLARRFQKCAEDIFELGQNEIRRFGRREMWCFNMRYLAYVHFVLNINLLDFPCPDIALFLITTCAYKYKLLARR